MSYVHQQRDFSHSKLFITHKFIFASRIRIVNIKLSMVKFALIRRMDDSLFIPVSLDVPFSMKKQLLTGVSSELWWVWLKMVDTSRPHDGLWMVPLIVNKLKSEMQMISCEKINEAILFITAMKSGRVFVFI